MEETPKQPATQQPDQTPATSPPAQTTETEHMVGAGVPEESEEETPGGIRNSLSTIAILIIAPLIAFALTTFVFQSYEVDGPSMETTLQNRDRLIVYKLPRTLSKITRNSYVPERGEIIIFTRQEGFEFGAGQKRQLIKRVIALPGERVVVKSGILTVYNEKHPDGFRPDEGAYKKAIITTPGDIDLVVPEGHVYVCGDNRTNSLDSRAFGPVPFEDIVGRLALRVYPFGKSQVY